MTHLIICNNYGNRLFPENSRKAQASSHASVLMPSMSATASLNIGGDTAPDFTIHSQAQVSGSIASTNDIISAARLSALPSFTSTVKTNGIPLFMYRWKLTRFVPSGSSLTDAFQPFMAAMCMMSLSVIY